MTKTLVGIMLVLSMALVWLIVVRAARLAWEQCDLPEKVMGLIVVTVVVLGTIVIIGGMLGLVS